MRLEHHLVGGYVRYISPHIIIIIIPMVSTYRKEMTNFPLFPFSTKMFTFILHLFYIYLTFILHLFYNCSTFVLLVSLFVGFVLHPLSDSLLLTNLIIHITSAATVICCHHIVRNKYITVWLPPCTACVRIPILLYIWKCTCAQTVYMSDSCLYVCMNVSHQSKR